MVKHTQTIRRLLPMNCLSMFDRFMGLALEGLRPYQTYMMVFLAQIRNGFLAVTVFVKSSTIDAWHRPKYFSALIHAKLSRIATLQLHVWLHEYTLNWDEGIPYCR